MELKYIGHSAIALDINGDTILIDPFIKGNPVANYNWRFQNITDILVTHGHGDHLGDAIEISKEKNATITATFELANYCENNGARVNAINLGSKITYPWGNVWFTPSKHSSSTPDGKYAGEAAGIVISTKNTKIYHAGDTAITAEMNTIREIFKPDLALLPIGGQYTMGVEEATIAAQMLGVKSVIPIHYNTFPQISANVEAFKYMLESKGIDVITLLPNEKIEL